MSGRTAPVLAAGGVLWRRDGPDLLVALVHRPRYEDWTLPKGKAKSGEHLLLAAVREIAEETGASVQVGRRLAPVEYPLADGGRKRVAHWSLRYRCGEHVPGDEVDRVCWLTVAEAAQRLTYPIDRAVLADFARVPADTATVVLMRHAKAGKRSEWRGEDRLRPLDKIGRRHAREVVPVLSAFGPVRVLAADRVRCEQTVAPTADHLGLTVESAPEFSDENQSAAPERALDSLCQLAAGIGSAGSALICSQGGAIPGLLDGLAVPAQTGPGRYQSRKGSVWVLSMQAGRVLAGDYYPHPNA